MESAFHRIIFRKFSSPLSGSMEKTNIQAQGWGCLSCRPAFNEWEAIWGWNRNPARAVIFGWNCQRQTSAAVNIGRVVGKGIALEGRGMRRKVRRGGEQHKRRAREVLAP